MASIIFVLDKKTDIISAPHALVYFGIVIFFVYFKVSLNRHSYYLDYYQRIVRKGGLKFMLPESEDPETVFLVVQAGPEDKFEKCINKNSGLMFMVNFICRYTYSKNFTVTIVSYY